MSEDSESVFGLLEDREASLEGSGARWHQNESALLNLRDSMK